MVHEYGHLVAYRIAGHTDAKFRLIPLMESVGISKQTPETQEKEFFINIMGSGICLAPMVMGFAISHLISGIAPTASQFLLAFAAVTAALNFVNLLPFWPLDGGRCLRSLSHTFWPGSTRTLMLIMSAATAAAAVHLQSTGMFLSDVDERAKPAATRRARGRTRSHVTWSWSGGDSVPILSPQAPT